jgi:hypothetical protein
MTGRFLWDVSEISFTIQGLMKKLQEIMERYIKNIIYEETC